jgi:hypothetical protein
VIYRPILFVTIVLWATIARGADFDNPPISYSSTAPQEAVAQLQRDLDTGKVKLDRKDDRGYLDSLLKALNIPATSQTLVFSQTSFQRTLISPKNPRALYFNDDTYVGFVPGGEVLEVAASDPKLGTIFYTVDQHANAAKPKIARQIDSCLQCHGESMTRDIPGLLVRSVFADETGQPILSAGTFLTTHESPWSERWGGWYATNSPPSLKHMGNATYTASENENPSAHPLASSRIQALSNYPTRTSDIIALLVLEHQAEAHNRITRASYGTALALRDEKVLAEALGEKLKEGDHSEGTLNRIKNACKPLVEYLLFANEATLPAPLDATTPFAKEFTARGPRDSKGRSLRDFDLKTRLFKYPCSYLIYSQSFNGLPDAARASVYQQLWQVLNDNDPPKAFAHLTAPHRAALIGILRETKPELRDAWKSLQAVQ